MMKAIVVTEAGGPEVLKLREIPKPEIQNDTDVLVKVKAAGINPGDWQARKNGPPAYVTYADGEKKYIPGMDGVGVIEAIGRSVKNFNVGDEVWYIDGGFANFQGSYAQYKVVNCYYLAPKPRSLSFIDAAALPVVALTSWEAVYERAAVKPDDFVLVHGGAGGLGHISIQLAKARGAKVASTVSGAAKESLVRALGTDLLIDYTKQNVAEAVKKWTGKDGADAVLDYIGRNNFADSFDLVGSYGTLVNTVVADWPKGDNMMAEYKNMNIKFVNIGLPIVTGHHEGRIRQAKILEEVSKLVDAGKLRVHIDRVVSFDGVGEAQRALEAGETIGRLVLAIEN